MPLMASTHGRYGGCHSPSQAPQSTVAPCASAVTADSRTNAVLPMPASPTTIATLPRPAVASARRARRTAGSSVRPTNPGPSGPQWCRHGRSVARARRPPSDAVSGSLRSAQRDRHLRERARPPAVARYAGTGRRRSPRSSAPMAAAVTLARSASSSCDNPAASRWRRNCAPNAVCRLSFMALARRRLAPPLRGTGPAYAAVVPHRDRTSTDRGRVRGRSGRNGRL